MDHHCHVPGCTVSTRPRLLTCGKHWRLIPVNLQNEVYATVDKRGPHVDVTWAPWWTAQAKAIHAAMVAEGWDKDACDRWLAKELRFSDELLAQHAAGGSK